jgi:hypothetical protein
MSTRGAHRGAALRFVIASLVMFALAAGTVPEQAAVAQQLPNDQVRQDAPQASAAPRIVAISRTPEGFKLGAPKSDIFDQMSLRWGSDYGPLNVLWSSYWYPRAARTTSGRFTPRRCFEELNVPLCEGTILRSTTASMIEIVAFQDRVFRISITLPAAPDYRLQSQNMLSLLRQKYGPSRDSRWRDELTELTFESPMITPGVPATLHYVDISRNTEAQRIVHKLIEDRNAERRARSLVAPKEY